MADGHIVGVAVAGAEDDGLLLGAAGIQEILEQVPAHGQDAVGQEDAVFVLGSLIEVFNLFGGDGLAGDGVHGVAGDDLFLGDTGVVEVHPALLDFAGGQVAVLDGLGDVVLVGRFAEIGEVVGGDLRVGQNLLRDAVGRGEIDIGLIALDRRLSLRRPAAIPPGKLFCVPPSAA